MGTLVSIHLLADLVDKGIILMIKNYSRVKLLTDRFEDEGLNYGDIGYVIEIYADQWYEVEFSNEQGITIAQIVAQEDEMAVCEPNQ